MTENRIATLPPPPPPGGMTVEEWAEKLRVHRRFNLNPGAVHLLEMFGGAESPGVHPARLTAALADAPRPGCGNALWLKGTSQPNPK